MTNHRKFFGSLRDVAEVDYTADPPTLVYRDVRGESIRLEGNDAERAWAEFIALLSACL